RSVVISDSFRPALSPVAAGASAYGAPPKIAPFRPPREGHGSVNWQRNWPNLTGKRKLECLSVRMSVCSRGIREPAHGSAVADRPAWRSEGNRTDGRERPSNDGLPAPGRLHLGYRQSSAWRLQAGGLRQGDSADDRTSPTGLRARADEGGRARARSRAEA